MLVRNSHTTEWLLVLLIAGAAIAGFDYQGATLTGLLLVALAALAFWPDRETTLPRPHGVLAWLMLVWLLWLALAIWWSRLPFVSWFYFWSFAGLPILFLAWQRLRDPDLIWRRLRGALPWGASILAFWGLYQAFIWQGNPAPSGPILDPNSYAAALNLFWFPLCAIWWSLNFSNERRLRLKYWGYLGAIALVTTALFATASRGATLVWLALLPLLAWSVLGSHGARGKALILGATALGGYAMARFITANYDFNEAVGRLVTGGDTSVAARLHLWQSTLDMIHDHPWLGTGLGTWGNFYPAYRNTQEHVTAGYMAHNDYLQLAQEGGVLTLALFLTIMMVVTRLAWQAVRATRAEPERIVSAGLMLGVMAVVLHAAINFIFYYAFMNILAGLFIGRAWRDIHGQAAVPVPMSKGLIRPVKWGATFILLVVMGQLLLHGVAQLLNCDHLVINALRRVEPRITEYSVARVVHALRPDEPVPLYVVLGVMRISADEAGLYGPKVQEAVIREVLDKYEWTKKRWPTDPRYGAEQAMLLVKHHRLLGDEKAGKEAERIAFEALKADPRHAESIIALAESQILLGRRNEALGILRQAVPHAFRLRDRRLLEVVYVRLLAFPTKIESLNELEERLRKIQPTDDVGRENPGNMAFYAEVERKLLETIRDLPPGLASLPESQASLGRP